MLDSLVENVASSCSSSVKFVNSKSFRLSLLAGDDLMCWLNARSGFCIVPTCCSNAERFLYLAKSLQLLIRSISGRYVIKHAQMR